MRNVSLTLLTTLFEGKRNELMKFFADINWMVLFNNQLFLFLSIVYEGDGGEF